MLFEQLEMLMMLMIVTTYNLDHPNVVKLVEVVDDPEEVRPDDDDDDHWEHSFRMLRKCCKTFCSSSWRN